MTMLPNSPEARDVAYQLHAYTNARTHQQAGPLVIERGEGPYVFDAAGNLIELHRRKRDFREP